jgi:hypothetical protein
MAIKPIAQQYNFDALLIVYRTELVSPYLLIEFMRGIEFAKNITLSRGCINVFSVAILPATYLQL